jgi:hypothetical protein
MRTDLKQPAAADQIDPLVRTMCCGEEVTTRFCPHCGEEKRGHDLMTLLAHCQQSLAKAEEGYAEAKSRESERSMKIKSAPLRKWSAWVAALEAVVNK